MHFLHVENSYLAFSFYKPCDIEGFLHFGLYRAKEVSTHLFQQLRKQHKQPVLEICFMNHYEVHQCLQEHAKHLHNTQTGNYQAIIESIYGF